MDKQQFQELLSKMQAGSRSADDERELYRTYNAYLKASSVDDFDEDKALSKMEQFALEKVFARKRSKTVRLRKWVASAAAVLLISGISYYLISPSSSSNTEVKQVIAERDSVIPAVSLEAIAVLPNGKQVVLNKDGFNSLPNPQIMAGDKLTDQFITIKTPRGSKLNFRLPDGSLVWLNAETTLTYPVAFGKNSRKVELKGEAFFEVTKQKIEDKSVPFIVDAGSHQVKVLGTKFNVNNYSDEEAKATTLVEGSVEVNNGTGISRLVPNQQYIEKGDRRRVIQVDVQNYVGWREGVIRLKKQDFATVARIIERNFNVTFDKEALPKGNTLNGELQTDVNIDELLTGLGATMGIKFSRKGRIIHIDSK